MEEEELAHLRAQQRAFEELRNAELVEQQRLEEQERRHREEKVSLERKSLFACLIICHSMISICPPSLPAWTSYVDNTAGFGFYGISFFRRSRHGQCEH